jgi:hypothetical protein
MVGERIVKTTANQVNLVLDETFEEKLKYSLDVLKPIISLINKCENPETTMVDVIEDWMTFAFSEKYSEIKSDITKRITPVALTANALHPIYRGKQFDHIHEYKKRVMEFLIDLLGAIANV